jgi:hypothetical protein
MGGPRGRYRHHDQFDERASLRADPGKAGHVVATSRTTPALSHRPGRAARYRAVDQHLRERQTEITRSMEILKPHIERYMEWAGRQAGEPGADDITRGLVTA